MNRTIAAIMVVVLVAMIGAAIFAAKLWMADASDQLGNWEDARAELTDSHRRSMRADFAKFGIDAEIMDTIADCITDRAIGFLSTTDCHYKYDRSNMSQSEHLAVQAACFKKVGYKAKTERFTVECLRLHFPDDWGVTQTYLAAGYTEALVTQGLPQAVANDAGPCIAEQLVVTLRKKDCRILNRQATTAKELINDASDCLDAADTDLAIAKCLATE